MAAIDPAEVSAKNPALGLLTVAVPMWIDQIRAEHLTDDQRIARAKRCGDHIAHHGDAILYRDKKTPQAFNALAEGLALAAFQPGGVSFAGMHWEATTDPEGGSR